MIFTNFDIQLSLSDIVTVENAIGVKLPEPLHRYYLTWNGGEPDPYIFENEDLDTLVTEFLPLISHSGQDMGSMSIED
jgi:hypothetical protein